MNWRFQRIVLGELFYFFLILNSDLYIYLSYRNLKAEIVSCRAYFPALITLQMDSLQEHHWTRFEFSFPKCNYIQELTSRNIKFVFSKPR